MRFEVMKELADRDWSWANTAAPNSSELSLAVERLLAGCVADTEKYLNCSMGYHDFSASDPRVCDFAVYALHVHWPETYGWRGNLSTRSEECQRLVALNKWRAKSGLAALPLPEAAEIVPVPDDRVRPLVARALGDDASVREDAVSEIEALGIGAYPFLAARLAEIDEKTPGYKALHELAQRLACIVLSAGWAEDGPYPGDAVRREAAKLEGVTLSYEAIRDLLVFVASHMPEGASGICIDVERDSDGGGAEIVFRMLKDPGHASWMDEGWVLGVSARSLGPRGTKTSGSAFAERDEPDEGCEHLRSEINELLHSAPHEPFSLSVSIARLE